MKYRTYIDKNSDNEVDKLNTKIEIYKNGNDYKVYLKNDNNKQINGY